MFHSIQICFLEIINNNPSNRIFKKLTLKLILILKKNSPFQEGIMSETFQRLDKSFFQNPKELGDLINKENLVHKFLPKQTYIDKILYVIQRKVLKGTHLQDIYIAHILKTYICIYHRINFQVQNLHLGNWKLCQRNMSY